MMIMSLAVVGAFCYRLLPLLLATSNVIAVAVQAEPPQKRAQLEIPDLIPEPVPLGDEQRPKLDKPIDAQIEMVGLEPEQDVPKFIEPELKPKAPKLEPERDIPKFIQPELKPKIQKVVEEEAPMVEMPVFEDDTSGNDIAASDEFDLSNDDSGMPFDDFSIEESAQMPLMDDRQEKEEPIPVTLAGQLAVMIEMIPEGYERNQLLSRIENSGVERMRDLGIRTRQYARYLRIWDALHFTVGENDAHVRDDVLQAIEKDSSIARELKVSQVQLIHKYESFRNVVTTLGHRLFSFTAPYFSSHSAMRARTFKGGRGVVLTGGNDQMPFLRTQIRHFRKLGLKLPIEVMYLGEDDLREQFREELERMENVVTRDIRHMIDDDGWQIRGWAGKPWALLVSSFQEAIFIDADSFFFQNPEVLFNHPDYKRTGALFFKDRLMMAESKRNWLRDFLPSPYSQQVLNSRPWQGMPSFLAH